MKALQITGKQQVEIIDVPMPKVEAPDDVLLRIRANSICNMHEWKCYNDKYHEHFKCEYPLMPGFPGHESFAEVVEVGPEARNVAVGDHVFLTSHAGQLHREYTVCSQGWVFKLKPEVSAADGAPLELFACAVGLLETSDAIADCRVAIIGMGSAGKALLQVLRTMQPREIIALDFEDAALDYARKGGADRVINSNDEAAVQALAEEGIESAIDSSGSQAGIQLAIKAAQREALLFGYNDQPLQVLQSDWFWKRLVIRTGNIIWQSTGRRTASLMNHGLIKPSDLVTHRVPFSAEGYAEAMGLIDKRACGKVLMEFPD